MRQAETTGEVLEGEDVVCVRAHTGSVPGSGVTEVDVEVRGRSAGATRSQSLREAVRVQRITRRHPLRDYVCRARHVAIWPHTSSMTSSSERAASTTRHRAGSSRDISMYPARTRSWKPGASLSM